LAVDEEPAGVGLLNARHDLDQRRLAGSVLTQQGVHLARLEGDGDVIERLRLAEPLRDVPDFDHGNG